MFFSQFRKNRQTADSVDTPQPAIMVYSKFESHIVCWLGLPMASAMSMRHKVPMDMSAPKSDNIKRRETENVTISLMSVVMLASSHNIAKKKSCH